jgi:hypothetical protein
MRRLVERAWIGVDRLIDRYLTKPGTDGATANWNWPRAARPSLARYVNPRCATRAVGRLPAPDGTTVADLRNTQGGATAIAKAAYDLIRTRRLAYDLEGYSDDGETTQRIRTPDEIVSSAVGTCLDLALLYAGYLIDLHVRTVVVVLEGHALVCVVAEPFPPLIANAETDSARLGELIAAGALLPVECTGFAVGQNLDVDFETACGIGAERIANRTLRFYIDPVHLQQQQHLRPLRCRVTSPAKIATLAVAGLSLLGGSGWLLWPEPAVAAMPASDGRNIALFPLAATGDATPADGRAVAQELTATFREELTGVGRWNIWGPTEIGPAPAPSDPDELLTTLRARNIDIAVIGSIHGSGNRRFVQVDAWLRPTARGVAEAGVSGPVAIYTNPTGTTGSLSRIARDLGQASDDWFAILDALSLMRDATVRDELLDIRSRLATTAAAADGELAGLARVLQGGTHLFIDATLGPDDHQARAANATLAIRPLTQVADDPNLPDDLRARASMGLAGIELNMSGCEPDTHDPGRLDRADQLLAGSVAPLIDDSSNAAAELRLRSLIIDGRIAYCRWRAGLSPPDRAEMALTAAIADFESRTGPDERARSWFHGSDAHGLRGLVWFDDRPEAAAQDLQTAYCLARPFSQEFWAIRYRELLDAHLPNRQPEVDCS